MLIACKEVCNVEGASKNLLNYSSIIWIIISSVILLGRVILIWQLALMWFQKFYSFLRHSNYRRKCKFLLEEQAYKKILSVRQSQGNRKVKKLNKIDSLIECWGNAFMSHFTRYIPRMLLIFTMCCMCIQIPILYRFYSIL